MTEVFLCTPQGVTTSSSTRRKQKGVEADRTQVHVWGKECGGENKDVLAPWVVAPLSGRHVSRVAAGATMTLAVTDAGEVFTWGDGCYGQLGHGTLERQTTPRVVEGLQGVRVAHASCGGYHVLATAVCGDVYSWGLGMFGQLGHGEQCNQTTPKRIAAFVGMAVMETAGGHCHSLAINEKGEVFSWGCGEDGRLGHGLNFRNHTVPTQISALQNRRVVKAACGALHSAVLTDNGEVFTWGGGDYGLLGHGDETGHPFPVRIETLLGHRVVSVSAGHCFTNALTDDGQLYSWGLGDNGELGHGDSVDRPLPCRIEFFDGRRIIYIASGSRHSVALTENYELFTWGCGANGQLGHGHQSDVDSPRRVESITKRKALLVACGYNHVVALSDVLRKTKTTPPRPSVSRSFSSSFLTTTPPTKTKRQWYETDCALANDAETTQRRIVELESLVNSLSQQLDGTRMQLRQKTREAEEVGQGLQLLQSIRNDELQQVLNSYSLDSPGSTWMGATTTTPAPAPETAPALALATPTEVPQAAEPFVFSDLDMDMGLMTAPVVHLEDFNGDVPRLQQEMDQMREVRGNLEKTVSVLMMELENARRAKRDLQVLVGKTQGPATDVEAQLRVETKSLDVHFLQQLTIEQLEDLESAQCERFRLVARVKAEKAGSACEQLYRYGNMYEVPASV
eukprot:TRINITY_DN4136_c0_g1_i1.p1 TRINITY_DN4136_c0_g1~~TRINITY_DN4136_c0_g1_i1.p1  ORF type:complete len:700 (+),score=115.76 TRINITY_DN4136_c0_g1_i1:59-2101(+)